jgi:L-ribulose-5-phosphate 3-epimerase
MQGRLLPAADGRIQSFPVSGWRDEFPFAREAGLDCIEWVYESETEAGNPLATEAGVEQVRALAEDAGIAVSSVCADYYMSVRLVDGGDVDADAVSHLSDLLARIAPLGVRYVVLPFVDESSLRSPEELSALERAIATVLPVAEEYTVELHLEADLHAADLAALLARIDHPLVRANYDTGNAASLGLPPATELPVVSPFLGSVHVKDRREGGTTVPLGSGAADFPTAFRLIQDAGFRGPYILQTARDEAVSEVDLARRNRAFVEELLAEAS